MDNSNRLAFRQMLASYPDVLDAEQMCRALGISTKTGYRLLKEGAIKGIKVGRAYRVPKIRVIEYLLQGTNHEK